MFTVAFINKKLLIRTFWIFVYVCQLKKDNSEDEFAVMQELLTTKNQLKEKRQTLQNNSEKSVC